MRAAVERELGDQARPDALAALEADRPADRLRAILEAEQAGAPGGICAADTVVADRYIKGSVAHLDLDLHLRRARVLGRVRQRL